MFFSLSKKFFFTIMVFFLLSAGIFLIIFEGIIGKKMRVQYSDVVTRNQYVIELLNENINLRMKLDDLQPVKPFKTGELISQKREELTRERRLYEELTQNYNEKYASLTESLKIISMGAALMIISLTILWFLLRRWVVKPLDKLTMLSMAVANGDFSQRIHHKKGSMTDEFDILMTTVNLMLDNIDDNIREIKQKEVFLQTLLDGLPDAIRVIDENYNIILSNKAYATYVHRNCLLAGGKCYQSYDDKADGPCNSSQYVCPIKLLKESNKSNVKLIHSVFERPLSINSAQINLNGGYAIVEAIRDLSENIHYSHQQKISSLAFLATSLAHEMKNNLGAINLILSGILQKYYSDAGDTSEEKKYLEMISNQIRDCIKVPERLLKLSREGSQNDVAFNVVSSVKDVVSLFDYEIKRKGIFLVEKLSGKREKLVGNETDFKMIVLNLVQNAIHAMADGGTLEVCTVTKGNELSVSIKDTGCGISPETLKHIFEPFYTQSQGAENKGTGLGLAIVKDLVGKFGAKIVVESKVNKGSCFKISFPRQKA